MHRAAFRLKFRWGERAPENFSAIIKKSPPHGCENAFFVALIFVKKDCVCFFCPSPRHMLRGGSKKTRTPLPRNFLILPPPWQSFQKSVKGKDREQEGTELQKGCYVKFTPPLKTPFKGAFIDPLP